MTRWGITHLFSLMVPHSRTTTIKESPFSILEVKISIAIVLNSKSDRYLVATESLTEAYCLMYQEVFFIHQPEMEKVTMILHQYSVTYLGNSSLLPNARKLKFPSKEVSELFAAKLFELGIISIGQYNSKMS